MTEKAILRIYMPMSAQFSGPRTFWQKLFGPSLGGFLVKKAKEFGIEQAILQRIMGGYLKGRKLAFEQGEIIPPDLPQCVELIDHENKLKQFLEAYREQITNCRVILLHAIEINNEQEINNAPLA